MQITDAQLIEKAKAIIEPRKIRHNMTIGDVGCALLSDSGNIYLGVCMDVVCGIGFCAEHSAIAAMVTAGEQKIKKIVAVSEYGIVSPCGRCRELISQIHQENRDTQIIIGKDKVVRLKELLPYTWDTIRQKPQKIRTY